VVTALFGTVGTVDSLQVYNDTSVPFNQKCLFAFTVPFNQTCLFAFTNTEAAAGSPLSFSLLSAFMSNMHSQYSAMVNVQVADRLYKRSMIG
jgi:hypothetical protein